MPESEFHYTTHVFFDELDALWVLHHSRYLHHLERAQQAFFQHLLGVPDFNAQRDPDIYVVVRNLNIHYRTAIRQPGEIRILYRVTRIRAAGLEMDFALRSGDGQTLHADGQRTVCKLSGEHHTPTNWTPAFQQALAAWQGKSA